MNDHDFELGARWLYVSPSGKRFIYKVWEVDGDAVRMISHDGISDATPSRRQLELDPQAWLRPLGDADA